MVTQPVDTKSFVKPAPPSSLVLMLLGGRGKAIHNNDETDTTYAPHRGSDVLMSFLTPFCTASTTDDAGNAQRLRYVAI